MAKVSINVTCTSCGKAFIHTHTCRNTSEASSYEVWVKENVTICPECYAKQQAAAQTAQANDILAKAGIVLPEITGISDKQIEYAAKLRGEFVAVNKGALVAEAKILEQVREAYATRKEQLEDKARANGVTDIEGFWLKAATSNLGYDDEYMVLTDGDARHLIDVLTRKIKARDIITFATAIAEEEPAAVEPAAEPVEEDRKDLFAYDGSEYEHISMEIWTHADGKITGVKQIALETLLPDASARRAKPEEIDVYAPTLYTYLVDDLSEINATANAWKDAHQDTATTSYHLYIDKIYSDPGFVIRANQGRPGTPTLTGSEIDADKAARRAAQAQAERDNADVDIFEASMRGC